MATLYSQSTQNTFSNFNDGTVANANYAWQFTPTASGTPTQVTLYAQGIVGTPTGNVYIKADKTIASTTYATATGVTFVTGSNVFTFTGATSITSGVTYWIYFQRTSASTVYPQLQYDTAKTNFQTWKPSASNIDPNTLWFTFDVKMLVEGTATSIKTINGLAQASVKTVNGLAIASVKSWNGLQ